MKNKKLLMVVTMIAVFVWGYNVYSIKSRLAQQKQAVESAKPVIAGIHHEKKEYDDKARDPFVYTHFEKPVLVKKVIQPVGPETPPPYSIDGMLWDEKNPSVVLKNYQTGDSKIISKGEVWDSIRIMDIKPDKVIIRFRNKTFTIQ